MLFVRQCWLVVEQDQKRKRELFERENKFVGFRLSFSSV